MVKSSLNAHTLLLLSYLVLVVGISFIQDVVLLMVCLSSSFLVSILFSAKAFWSLLQQTLYSIAWFTMTISLGYAMMIWLQNSHAWDALLRLNLRVLLLTFMTFTLIHYLNFFKGNRPTIPSVTRH